MFKDDVAHYLSEIARVLKPSGKCLVTWFLLDEVSRQSQHPVMQFNHDVDDVSKTTLKSNPEAAIAFDINFVRGLYERRLSRKVFLALRPSFRANSHKWRLLVLQRMVRVCNRPRYYFFLYLPFIMSSAVTWT